MKRNPRLEGWREIKLREVCREITVGHVGPMASEYGDDGIPFLRSQNIQPFRLDLSGLKYITPEFHQRLRKSSIAPGDVVVVRTGYPGTACVVPKRMTVANCADLVIVRPSPELDPWFLASVFNSTWGRRTVAGKLVGVAQQHFNIGAAREMLIRLPPVEVQRRIAAILSTYDELIENNTRRIKILEEMAQAIYREWFVHFRFPGHKKVKLVNSPPGPIPEGWSGRKLGEVVELAYGKALKAENRRKGNVPVYGSSGIVGFHDESLVSGPGIIVGRKGNVGTVHWCDGDFFPIDTVFYVQTNIPLRYTYYNLQTQNFISGDAAVPGLSRTQAYSLPILVPAENVLTKFEGLVEGFFAATRNLQERNKKLRETRDLLLPKLISGELDVSKMVVAGERGGESG